MCRVLAVFPYQRQDRQARDRLLLAPQLRGGPHTDPPRPSPLWEVGVLQALQRRPPSWLRHLRL